MSGRCIPIFSAPGKRCAAWARAAGMTDVEVYREVVETTRSFCTEAVGVRGHRQFFDSTLLPIYREYGLEYDSSLFLPLVSHLTPVRKPHEIVELPIYYIDHSDLNAGYTGFDLAPAARPPGPQSLRFPSQHRVHQCDDERPLCRLQSALPRPGTASGDAARGDWSPYALSAAGGRDRRGRPANGHPDADQ